MFRWQRKRLLTNDLGNLLEYEGNNVEPEELDYIFIDNTDFFYLLRIGKGYGVCWEVHTGAHDTNYENWFFFEDEDKARSIFEEIKRCIGELNAYKEE
jgi:hypothetical protein